MERMIFRNDDVSPSTDLKKLSKMYDLIREYFPECEIWSCVTLFGQLNANGSVYGDVPFKHKDIKWFYKTDCLVEAYYYHSIPKSKVVSHGLFHVDHSKLSRDAQEMSIVGSCRYLNTNIFVPPFNRYNLDTKLVCEHNNIRLIGNDYWRSLEFESINPDHKFWYFHSWRYTQKSLKKSLTGSGCLR